MNSKLSLFLIFLFANNVFVFSQNGDIYEKEQKIAGYFQSIRETNNDSIRYFYNQELKNTFNTLLQDKKTFSYPFDSLKYIFISKSPDNFFRIYNWNIQYSDGNHKYFGYIQIIKNKTVTLIQLRDRSDSIPNPENVVCHAEKWFGALYYTIILKKISRQPHYTLLGWDGNNNFTHKKIIDVLTFDKSNTPKFGADIFRYNRQTKKRVLFEYSSNAYMTLRYDEKEKMIIYDALSPRSPLYEGKFEFYGPDGTYDALVFKKKYWLHKSDVDIRNPR